ncbi:hypothetical protein [Alcaligenes sp. SMD-FA]|uniref:hypothetical protein n=1 Tax=Alcaligenes sp. SMD-FA TaxID=2991054 RepID=UPI0022272AEE|nr:hypothetical protein [Alcaligenes sp. SMD-FA]UYY85590.1 hypothetical protein OKX01_09650 [Alcaligenes sp. SMD-FA]
MQTHPGGFAFFSFNFPGGTIRLGLSSSFFGDPMIVVRYFTLPLYTTDRNRTDDRLIWTGPEPIPAIGDTVMVRFNSIGQCKVVCFASQGPYLGLLVYPLQPPSWWVSQNGEPSPETAGLVFGREISLVDAQEA